jgi:EAL domain-containing protein (putative c-di-GMP-specific phosphodiesterase class I)
VAGAATIESLGQQLREVLPKRRMQSVSLCDHEANVLWLSEGALGPDEHSLIVEALEVLNADHSLQCHELPVEDGRLALFLPVRTPTGSLVGIGMILADSKSVGDDTLERIAATPVRAILLRLAVLLKPGVDRPVPINGTAVSVELPDSLDLVPDEECDPAAAAPPAAVKRVPVISAEEVNDILEFELSAEETRNIPVVQSAAAVRSARSAETSSEMMSLEFIGDTPASRVAAEVEVTPIRSTAAAKAPAEAPRPPAAAPVAPPAAAPLATPLAANDPNLLLEIVPFAKLRAGGQSRRFQVLARMSPAQRDPAACDALVLQRLMGWLAAHRGTWNSQPTGFTVNLSIATLEDERFVQKLSTALNSHGIAAETIGFEIAEALCTQRRAQVERFINQCEKIGSWVVIDDFSFDSAVLPLLRSRAMRLVKSDQKLSSSALKDKLSQALVVATVQAAKVLGIHCSAKKVDSQAALQWLTAIGCDFAQGAALAPVQSLDSLASSPDPTGLTAQLRPS